MSILSRWFRKLKNRKKRKYEENVEIQVENSLWSSRIPDDPLAIKNHVVNLCEQMTWRKIFRQNQRVETPDDTLLANQI